MSLRTRVCCVIDWVSVFCKMSCWLECHAGVTQANSDVLGVNNFTVDGLVGDSKIRERPKVWKRGSYFLYLVAVPKSYAI